MDKTPAARNIFTFERKSSVDRVIKALVEGLGGDGDLASASCELAQIGRDKYDVVMMDMCCVNLDGEVVEYISTVRPSLVGRVLILTAELPEPKLALIEKCVSAAFPKRHWRRYLRRIWSSPRSMRSSVPSPGQARPAQQRP